MARFGRLAALSAAGIGLALTLAVGVTAGPVGATHKGEKIVVSKTDALQDGDSVRVTFSGFAPGGVDGTHPNAKIVIAGQNTFTGVPDKLNFDEYASAPEVLVGADGTGATDYVVFADHGTVQDGTTLNCAVNKCWLIAIQEPFLGPEGQPRYAAQAISFGSVGVAPTAPVPTNTTPATTQPSATTAAPGETTSTASVPAETTTTTEPEVTTTTEPTATTPDDTVTVKDEEGSNTGLIIGIVAGAAVVLGGGAFLATRKKPPMPPTDAPES